MNFPPDRINQPFRGRPVEQFHLPQTRFYHDKQDIFRRVKVDAPEYDGRLDPNAFLDWLASIEDFFEWYETTDAQHVRFAK